MKLPLRRIISLPYGDTRIFQFKVIRNDEPYNLSGKILWFGVLSRYLNYQLQKLNMVNEGWIIDPLEGLFKVVLDTLRFNMRPGLYEFEVELEESQNFYTTLVHYEVDVLKDVIHQ